MSKSLLTKVLNRVIGALSEFGDLADNEKAEVIELFQSKTGNRVTARQIVPARPQASNGEIERLQQELSKERNISADLRNSVEDRAEAFERYLVSIYNVQKACYDTITGLLTFIQILDIDHTEGMQLYRAELEVRIKKMESHLDNVMPTWRNEMYLRPINDHFYRVLEMVRQNENGELLKYAKEEEPTAYAVGEALRLRAEQERKRLHTTDRALVQQQDRELARPLFISEGEADRPKEMRLHQWQKVRDRIVAKWTGRETGLTDDQRRGLNWLRDASPQSLHNLMKGYP